MEVRIGFAVLGVWIAMYSHTSVASHAPPDVSPSGVNFRELRILDEGSRIVIWIRTSKPDSDFLAEPKDSPLERLLAQPIRDHEVILIDHEREPLSISRIRPGGRRNSEPDPLWQTLSRIPWSYDAKAEIIYAGENPVLIRTVLWPRGKLGEPLAEPGTRTCVRRIVYVPDAGVQVTGCGVASCPMCSRH